MKKASSRFRKKARKGAPNKRKLMNTRAGVVAKPAVRKRKR